MPSESIDDRLLALAMSLHIAWHEADAKLRADLERVIRDHAKREPGFQAALKHVIMLHEEGKPLLPWIGRTQAFKHVLPRIMRSR